MDVIYWTFANRSGKWCATSSVGELACGICRMPVTWADSSMGYKVPVDTWGSAGTRWIEGKAVQEGNVPIKSVWDTQVGGSHYTDMAIQPFQFSMANKLDPMQHTIIKYVTRFRAKNGIQDLEKAKQTLDLLIQWEKANATQAKK